MDIKKPLLVKVEAFIYAFVYSCVRSSATPSLQGASPEAAAAAVGVGAELAGLVHRAVADVEAYRSGHQYVVVHPEDRPV